MKKAETPYKTPKVSLVRNAIQIVETAESIAESIENDGYGNARITLDDLESLTETLRAQLETR